MSTFGPISSKRAGSNAEASVVDVHPEFEHVPDTEIEHADVRVAELLEASPEIPIVGMCLLEVGTLVEVKSAMVRLSDGRRGRFYLREEQHRALVDEAGVYLFAVCEPRPERPILALKIVPATTVGDLVETWRDAGDDRPRCAQLAWSRVFYADEVNGGSIE